MTRSPDSPATRGEEYALPVTDIRTSASRALSARRVVRRRVVGERFWAPLPS
ncbi:hypothetical protein [Marisediminicola sp. LYQ134]|uniref:hypothetical protein n=1 Tax=unclassified Marisediminicola TaxID=2618316 RepID=UPI003982E6F4